MEKLREKLNFSAKNNAIRSNYIEAKIDKNQENSNCRLRRDKDQSITPIVASERKGNIRLDTIGAVKEIHGELCKKLKFILTTKWLVHKPESVPENEMNFFK